MNRGSRIAALLVVASGCARHTAVAPDSAPTGASSHDPHVFITGDSVVLNGLKVAATADLKRLTRLDGLFKPLRAAASDANGQRDVWFDFDPSASSVAAASAMATAAFAGFRKAHVHVGDLATTATYYVPLPNQPAPFTRVNLALRGGAVRAVWQSTRACGEVPGDEDVPLAGFASYLDRMCGGTATCVQQVQVAIDSSASLADVLRLIAAGQSHAVPEQFTFSFTWGVAERSCGKVPTSMGILGAEVIQHVVRQSFGPFATCYENALRGNPKLQGRVAVRFTIEPDGSVPNPSDGGSDIPDAGVIACVVKGFSALRFPPPDGGVVTVVYPIVFNPGD